MVWCQYHFPGFLFFCFYYLFILFIYLWLCWVFVSVRGLSPVPASRGHSSSRRAGLSLSRPLLLRSTGSRRAGSVVVAHGPSCSTACGIFPDQGSNPCALHRQADSQPLRHQGSPVSWFWQWTILCKMPPLGEAGWWVHGTSIFVTSCSSIIKLKLKVFKSFRLNSMNMSILGCFWPTKMAISYS